MKRSEVKSAVGKTIAEELDNREQCRYGLRGVQVTIKGREGNFVVSGTGWGKNGRLEVSLLPKEVSDKRETERDPEAPLRFITSSELMNSKPDPDEFDVEPELCVLASEWPHVCGCYFED